MNSWFRRLFKLKKLFLEVEKKKDTKNFYNMIANSYDLLYGQEQIEKYKLTIKLGNIEFKGKLLDGGCGSGLFEETFKEKTKNCLIFGVDISRKLLDKAKQKTVNQPNVFLVCGDLDYLPFPPDMFDFCVVFTVLQNLPNPKLTLKEIKRVLRKEACLIATYLKTKISLEGFRSLLQEAGLKGEILDKQKVNEYIAIYRNS